MTEDLECEGQCRKHRNDSTWKMLGNGTQVRYNAVAGMSLCASCQTDWSAWWVDGYAKPWWVAKGAHRPNEEF